jgi:hypothetical protein
MVVGSDVEGDTVVGSIVIGADDEDEDIIMGSVVSGGLKARHDTVVVDAIEPTTCKGRKETR